MELKVIINALIIIFIIYLILDNINYSYSMNTSTGFNNNINTGVENNVGNNVENNVENKIPNGFDNSLNNKSLQFLTDNSNEILDNNQMKKELLDYVQSTTNLNPNENKVEHFKEDTKIKPNNFWITNDNVPNFTSNVMDVSKFYDTSAYDGINMDNINTQNNNETSNKELDTTIIDKQSQQSCFLDGNNNSDFTTMKPDNWKYKNETPMNGGSMSNGIVGFDSMDSGFAVYNKDSLTLQSCAKEAKCNIYPDDLRNGMSKEANFARDTDT